MFTHPPAPSRAPSPDAINDGMRESAYADVEQETVQVEECETDFMFAHPPMPSRAPSHDTINDGRREPPCTGVEQELAQAVEQESAEQIAKRMSEVVSALVSEQLPSVADLAQALDNTVLANLVIALAVEVKAARVPAGKPPESARTTRARSTGKRRDPGKCDRSRSRRRVPVRGHSRNRDERHHRERHRSKSKKDRDRDRRERAAPKKASPVAERRPGVRIEERKGDYRVECTFGNVSNVGPWRKSIGKAKEDGDAMEKARREGGDAAVQTVKRQLHLESRNGGSQSSSTGHLNVRNSGTGDVESVCPFPYPTEIEGPSSTPSSLGGYRAACTFPSGKTTSFNGLPRKSITVKAPWRMAAGARAAAEADAQALCDAFEHGGSEAMEKKKAELFRFADEHARTSKSGGQGLVEEDGLTSSKNGNVEAGSSPIADVEGPEITASGMSKYRASCQFPAKESSWQQAGTQRKPVPVKGPWREGPDSHSLAKADAMCMCEAFEDGGHEGMRKANAELFRTAQSFAGAKPSSIPTINDVTLRYDIDPVDSGVWGGKVAP